MSPSPSARTSQIAVGDTFVTYHDSGPVRADDRPLLLLPGTGGTTATHFGHLFPMMATRTRVIGLEWSPPPPPAPLTVDVLTDHVRAVADAALGETATFDLLGYSLGAVIAGAVAAELGSRVEHLVLVAGWLRTDPQQMLRNQVWRALYDRDRDALRRYITFCGTSGTYLAKLQPRLLETLVAGVGADELTRQQMELNASIDLTEEFERITAKTLIVSCTDDVMVPCHHQHQLLGAILDARLTYVSSGHAIFVERPAELMEITDLFLREPGRYAAGTIIPETRA